ncbi:MAG: hypothetical protein KH054_06955 [Firmicutes bacterium]|jgi:hypothetical protein|nr:hypothetical protein [Bacillota bacterium]
MNEEIEYAEMLEIPVSTVNVVKKKNRRVRGKNAPNLKERLISRVNNRVGDPDYSRAAPADALAQDPLYAAAENAALEDAAQNSPLPESEVNAYAYSDGGERMDTVLLSDEPAEKGWRKKKKLRFSEEDAAFEGELSENESGRYAMKTPSERRSGVFLTVEFALACALCGTIFLTNVFVPQSAINTFFRSLMPAAAEKADTRVYSDFTLTSIVSELSDAEITVSPTGVLTFTDECCVYPAVDGKVASVLKNSDGTYDVKISHTDSFYGVIGGLDYVYYQTGDKVYANVPVGYSKGETAVRVMMYSGDELLNCYTVDSENCLTWAKSET